MVALGALFLQGALPAQNTSPAGQTTPSNRVNLQVILVDSPLAAQAILDRLKKGEDFAALAKEKSIDPTASDGGIVGVVATATLRPESREALAGLKPGQITGAIKVPSGYLILKVLPEKRDAAGQDTGPAQGMAAQRNLHLAGRGAIQYPADVAGQVIAEMLFQKFPKPANWSQDLHSVCDVRKQSLAQAVQQLEQLLADPQRLSNMRPFDVVQEHYALAQIEAYQGSMDKAVEQWEAAYRIASAQIPVGVPQLIEVLGVAYLHKSEMENDVYRKPGERCLFPPPPGVRYQKAEDSEKAIEYFRKYLELKPERAHVLQVKWLLNLAYMTLGEYPQGVPKQYLISPAAFRSKEDIGRFVDVAPAVGLDFFSMAGGVIVDDFDNDGQLDIVASTFDMCGPLRYFHNNGDGTFTDRAAQAGLADQLGGLNMIQADYNNDGCMDILVLRGAWEFPVRKSLLRNNCDGTFTDVTREAGLAEPATRTQTAVWADIDNDGWLDLFVGNENGPNQLFRNRGDGTFEDISHSAGVDRIAYTKGVVAADYDNDGYVDFYISNLYDGNFLYHNNHNRTFTEVSEHAGVHQPQSQSFATWFFDYDNDGLPDLFVNGYFFSVDETLRSYLGLPHSAETTKLYRNLGNGTFKDVTAEVGLDKVFISMGANFGDVDNDGFPDIYLATGGPEYGALVPNVLLRNNEGKFFVDITASSGTGDLHKGHAVAFADLENNGREDILVNSGGATPGDAHAFRIFENPGNANDWIHVRLVGVKTNRAAIGAQIKVTVENEGHAARFIYRVVGSGGSFGASPLEQHIGLGKSARILQLEVWWPASSTRQNFSSVSANQFIEIKEFAKDYTKLQRKQIHLGGAQKGTVAQEKQVQENADGKQ